MGFVYISGGMSEALFFFITVLSHVHCFLNTTTSRTTTHCYSHHKLIPKIHVYTCVRAHTHAHALSCSPPSVPHMGASCSSSSEMLQHTVPCNTLQHTAIPCNTLQHTANCNTLQNRGSVLKFHLGARQGCAFLQLCSSRFVAVCCSVLQCVAVCCSVLQCVAVCCSSRFVKTACTQNPTKISVLKCVAVSCSMLQYVAVCSSVLQCVAVQCNMLQNVAIVGRVMQ